MPNKDPEIARKLKHEWYVKHREELLKRKREQRAAKKKLRPPKPPKPIPTPDEKKQAREANRLSCIKYRASHLEQVRLNRDYYRRHREKITQQQRDRRALAKKKKQNPVIKLQALADVASQRLIELEHGYAQAAEDETGFH